MKYDLFLFDLDDTLLDFQESERLSFFLSLQSLGFKDGAEDLFKTYQIENSALWKLFEQNLTTQAHLKVERFRKTFTTHKVELDPEVASTRYLEALPETVVLIDHAVEICDWLSHRGEVGIITNGIHHIQTRRINNSKLAPYISFVSSSDQCGFAKPDIRFFEFSAKMAKKFSKASSIIVGDRIEADIQGAHNFGIDACWFNPNKISGLAHLNPKYVIKHLSEIKHFE